MREETGLEAREPGIAGHRTAPRYAVRGRSALGTEDGAPRARSRSGSRAAPGTQAPDRCMPEPIAARRAPRQNRRMSGRRARLLALALGVGLGVALAALGTEGLRRARDARDRSA